MQTMSSFHQETIEVSLLQELGQAQPHQTQSRGSEQYIDEIEGNITPFESAKVKEHR